MTTGRVYTVEQAAKSLGVHPNTVRRAVRIGELKGIRDGLKAGHPYLFSEEAIQRFRELRQPREEPANS